LSLILSLGTGFDVFYELFLIATTVCIVSIIWAYFNSRGIQISFHRTYTNLNVGNEIISQISVSNKTPLSKWNIVLTDLEELSGKNIQAVINIPANSTIDVVLSVKLEKRGIFTVKGPYVYHLDPFGLHKLSHRSYGTREFIIFPRIVDIPPFSMPEGEVAGEGPSERIDPFGSTSISTIREYQPGDSTRNIHWPSTARRGSLMLKQFDSGKENVVWILLDMHSAVHNSDNVNDSEEYSITAAASVTNAYLENGWSVGLICHADKEYIINPEEGRSGFDKILMALTVIHAEGQTSLSLLLKYWQSVLSTPSDNIIVITPSSDMDWISQSITQNSNATPLALILIDIDTNSFVAKHHDTDTTLQINSGYIPTYTIKKGDDIKSSLTHRSTDLNY